jgi:hypothetical protein
MNSKYLYLSEVNREILVIGAAIEPSNPIWVNLPTISQSSRECYLTITDATIVFNSTQTHDSLNIKINIPTSNYFSSDNKYPMVAFMDTTDNKLYRLQHENKINILTNDNLKRIEFILEDNNAEVITLSPADSMEVMIKLDYINQDEMTQLYISQKPRTLD